MSYDRNSGQAHGSMEPFARYSASFVGVLADTPFLVRAAQSLRYQVYCLERHFEEPSQHLDGLEHDEDDARSVPGLLYFRHDPDPIGTARLILPGKERESLPVQRLLAKSGVRAAEYLPNSTTAEVSRFSISIKPKRFYSCNSCNCCVIKINCVWSASIQLPCITWLEIANRR